MCLQVVAGCCEGFQRLTADMALDLLLALGLPLVLVLLVSVLLLRGGGHLPVALEKLRRHEALLWNGGIGLFIAIAALRWLLRR